MSETLEMASAPAEQAKRHQHRSLRLSECGDTLSIAELCGVLGISRVEYYRMKSHRTLPVKPLAGLRFRFSKAQVQRYLERGA